MLKVPAQRPALEKQLDRLGEILELSAIDKRLENVLLDIEVVVIDRGELVAQRR